MQNFYLILLTLSGAYLTAQLIAWLFFGKSLFPNAGELFEKRTAKIELQTIFPKNLLRLIIFIFTSALIGLLLDLAGLAGWIGLPIAATGGIVGNFLLNTVFSPLYFKATGDSAPKGAELEGSTVTVTEDILPDEYGTISVKKGRLAYYYRAMSANGRLLTAGTKAVVILCEEELCFVESEERLYDVLFDDGANTDTMDFTADERNGL